MLDDSFPFRSPNTNPAMMAALIAHQHFERDATHMATISQNVAMGLMGSLLVDREIGFLDEELATALPIRAAVRRIALGYNQFRHICDEHDVSIEGLSEQVFDRIADALASPRYIRNERKGNHWEIIGYLSTSDRHLSVVLKYVPPTGAGSKAEEIWVATAFHVGKRTLKRWIRTEALRRFVRDVPQQT